MVRSASRPRPSSLNPAAYIALGTDALRFRWGFEGDAQYAAAREVNGNEDVPTYSVVRMTHVGYDPEGKPAFLFHYPKMREDWEGMKPHDHRGNADGGFAFAVFHPGTSISQMPYAL